MLSTSTVNGMAAVTRRRHLPSDCFLPALGHLAVFLLLAMPAAAAQAEGTQSLSSAKDFSSLRPCAKSCFWRTNFQTRTYDYLGSTLKCELTTTEFQTISVAMNGCYCRTDLQANAYQSLSRCVSRFCSGNSNDLSSAASIYSSYCTSNGFIANNEAAATGAGDQGGADDGQGGSGSPQKTGGGGDSNSGAEMGSAGRGMLVIGLCLALFGRLDVSW
ncbi:hypothetical protein DCS_05651 [Drechmeria coniospora]|uniref:Extracellular membrane protein CFEM domain-containing protein n=1 Tax=Drechmeria coniospora TaxID=98403 RepID=A0A151GND5_DRECN|nr:hypothetical protein DCS_05651 [Drechmeria coniospora]KYK58634.1 hypothetical protein DCS_05651 [Drechmeria coniospora]ODA83998.1 hypothetical protein RJ55_02516 [Drechmeria coniospora]